MLLSWSWVSFDGELAVTDPWYSLPSIYCEAIDASVTHSSLDSFGQFSGGMITLRGSLKKLGGYSKSKLLQATQELSSC
jgi:hypothetical protein